MRMHGYSEKEKEILYSAIKELNDLFPVEPSVDEVHKSYIDMWDLSVAMSEKKVEYGDQGERACVLARNIALRYAYLAMMIDGSKHKDGFLLSSLLQTISDTIIAIIKLAEDGLEYQAFVLIRTLFELFMTLLIVVKSPEKREAYKKAQTPEDSYKVWRSDFTKTKFINMLEQYSNDYPDLLEPAKKWVTEDYGFLSSFVHNDSINVMLYTKPIFDQDGVTHHSFWGEYVTRKGEIFNRLVKVVAPCDLIFFSMLNDSKIDLSMNTLLVDEETLPNTIRLYWMMDGLRKICLLLLAGYELNENVKLDVPKVDCPFFRAKNEDSL